MKILLVEDDIDVSNAIAEYLQYHAIAVDFAYNVQQATAALFSETFDLIIMDINLPDGNGIDLCRQLKHTYDIKQPVLFLSAKGQLNDKLQAFESGGVDYMVKPFSMQELHARIKALNAHINAQEHLELKIGPLLVCIKSGSAHYQQHQLQLHGIGLKLLVALMRSHPKTISSEHLCSIIWQHDTPKSNPLKAHISRLNAQFRQFTPDKLIVSLRGIGYQLNARIVDE